ncbi:MAG: YggS family pyridoxal phosphate-dependent enzyme [Alphaproteobacteria bacterium]
MTPPPSATAEPASDKIAARLQSVLSRIASAATAAGRPPRDVRLIAVSKTHDAPSIAPVIVAGQRLFGENRVQEAASKWPPLRAAHPDLALHLIGPLQTNKVREAVALFDVIQTVDRPKLARMIAEECARTGRSIECLIQVNTGEEPQKGGIAPTEAPALIDQCRETFGLTVTGLMCIPPQDEEPAPHFALLADLAARHGLARLSMGMSADFEVAIEFGATDVRVGTAIFGTRPA